MNDQTEIQRSLRNYREATKVAAPASVADGAMKRLARQADEIGVGTIIGLVGSSLGLAAAIAFLLTWSSTHREAPETPAFPEFSAGSSDGGLFQNFQERDGQ